MHLTNNNVRVRVQSIYEISKFIFLRYNSFKIFINMNTFLIQYKFVILSYASETLSNSIYVCILVFRKVVKLSQQIFIIINHITIMPPPSIHSRP